LLREWNRGRPEIRVLDCQETTPAQVGFPGTYTIARLQRRVRRQGQKTPEIVYLISRLTLDEFDARGLALLKRGYWVIESRLHHSLDVTMAEDQSRVRHRNAALVLGLFRRVAVTLALTWLETVREVKPRATVGRFQKRFHHHQEGPARLQTLIFAKSPTAWRLP
jgi:hypothetical protein